MRQKLVKRNIALLFTEIKKLIDSKADTDAFHDRINVRVETIK